MNYYDEEKTLEAFSAPSTYQNDYKWYKGAKKDVIRWDRSKSEKPAKGQPPAKFDDHETFATWREGVHVPFDLLLQPKPITQTNPDEPFEIKEIIADEGKDESIKTRPRVYMTPAVSIDDIPDAEMRKFICDNMYTTVQRRAELEATTSGWCKQIPPNKTKELATGGVKLQIDFHKNVPAKYRGIGRKWNKLQTRSLVDPTRTFWINKDPPVVCGACVNPLKDLVPKETKEEIAALLKADKLRLPHDKPMQSYCGYRPNLTYGVTLSKVDLPTVHPFLSTAQAITARYAEDNLKKK